MMNIMSSINQKRLLWAIISLIIVIACIFVFNNTKSASSNSVSVETYKVKQGWGYLIRKGQKKIIDQPYMPCIAGNLPFPDEVSAKNTGELVASKVSKDELPTITHDELVKIIGNRIK
ncbi:DUF4907 domain-containing protein [Dysgonomonas capnocytophagoides]|uniref:DUF4907 domain-containing protein n=2 Tax=Dysgonomonadaceae TaxID=2005520 RepID=A0A4Y8L7I9_9BACT|nr:DUF4907 domain-containing protein [Dysgonomonas capnocytophagoides]BES59824.1 hypothetical protein DCPSUM001_00680 [Dysgonomonas capnocytophagoides]